MIFIIYFFVSTSLLVSEESSLNETGPPVKKLTRTACYRYAITLWIYFTYFYFFRNFVYYMDKRSYQVKYDGLARTLIERVAPVLLKTRLALLQTTEQQKIKIKQTLTSFMIPDSGSSQTTSLGNNDEIDDELVDTDNPATASSTNNINIGELTIEKWLLHVLKSCSTMKTICSHADEMFKHNWLKLHDQLGLPSLLPLYFFILNVLLDVMNECLRLYDKPPINSDTLEIDSLCRQQVTLNDSICLILYRSFQLVREAKLILRFVFRRKRERGRILKNSNIFFRDALASRLYTIRMMEQFISHRQLIDELVDFDENIVKLYTVCLVLFSFRIIHSCEFVLAL